ncbi:MAG: 50S ribosomal protein L32 [Thermacetogeniaceae bacterium]
MGVPKRKTSKARKNRRRAMIKITGPTLVPCPKCHQPKLAHHACSSCGYYKDRQVVEV